MARTALAGYTSYNFKDHDPVLDQIDRLYELVGKNGKPVSLGEVERLSGVSRATLQKWKQRKTKKPQNATTEAVIRGLGGKRVIEYNGTIIRPPKFG